MIQAEMIIELMQAFDRTSLSKLRIRQADTDLLFEKKIDADPEGIAVQRACGTAAGTQVLPVQTDRADSAGELPADPNLLEVKAPLVGTFYAAPEENAPPYVKVGDWVEQGQTLCILEAMKMMNEIPSPAAGRVVRILPQNEKLVGFDDVLIEIKIDALPDGD